MRFDITTKKLDTASADCIILPFYTNNQLSADAKVFNKILKGKISKILSQSCLSDKIEKTLTIHQLDDCNIKNIVLVNCGENKTLTVNQFRKIISSAQNEIKKLHINKLICTLHTLKVKDHDSNWNAREIIISLANSNYRFDAFKSKKSDKHTIKNFTFYCNTTSQRNHLKKSITQAEAITAGLKLTRDLGNTPPNICNPTYLVKEAKKMAGKFPEITTKILEEKDAKKLGMGAFLSVSEGSKSPGKIIIMQYHGGKASQKPTVFIGKGVTFDTGGNNIKVGSHMSGMKLDMCGAATVFGIIKAAAIAKIKQNIIIIAACAENMVSDRASRPGDVVKSMAGITIEITNTDAEGRLVLCDAMTYSKKFNAAETITIATLTGSAVGAFGHIHTALMANSQQVANKLLKAGNTAEDPAWQLPLSEDYFPALESDCADTINVVLNRKAGTIRSGCFLSKFAEDLNWAHLDIAGSSMIPGKSMSASGRPVAMLMQYLFDK